MASSRGPPRRAPSTAMASIAPCAPGSGADSLHPAAAQVRCARTAAVAPAGQAGKYGLGGGGRIAPRRIAVQWLRSIVVSLHVARLGELARDRRERSVL